AGRRAGDAGKRRAYRAVARRPAAPSRFDPQDRRARPAAGLTSILRVFPDSKGTHVPHFRSRRSLVACLLVAGSALLVTPAMVSAQEKATAQASPAPSKVRAEADALAAEIVGKLTLDEKLPQLLNTAPAIPRLGIPAYNWWTESLHGALGTVPTTNFPEPIGLAATFDAP